GASLRGDEDHPVGAAGAVDGGVGGVLQDLHRFDVARVDGGERVAGARVALSDREAVDHVERLAVRRDRVTAADAHGDACAGCAGVGDHLYAGRATLEGAGDRVGGRRL